MKARRILVAALAVVPLTLSGCGFSLYNAQLPGGADLGDHPYTIYAYLANVLDLVPQSAVKVQDVPRGKVTAVSLSTNSKLCKTVTGEQVHWCAKVKMSINGSVNDLPANTHAEIQQTSLLGEKYVALVPPVRNASTKLLHNKSRIPFLSTTSAPDVEQVLGALSLLLNNGGFSQIQVIATELNKALGTRQRREALRSLVTDLTTFLGTLDAQKGDITNALDSIDKLAVTLNQQKKVLTDALDTFPAALRVLNADRDKLVTLLSSLSNLGSVATRVINATQTELVSSLRALNPVVTRLAQTGSAFPKSLRILGTFPFPLGVTRQIIRGDYANLDAVLNLSLTDQLCGLLPPPLGTIFCNLPGSANSKQPASTSSAKKAAATPNSLPPMLIGAGR
ncbi:MAG TPA: MlaD family protein [Jatrophihabitantaceae bacterium]|nr:MlaD family protein [Jatrophihabitantaceae bacterium]